MANAIAVRELHLSVVLPYRHLTSFVSSYVCILALETEFEVQSWSAHTKTDTVG